jgi:hypothetical protein
MRERDIEAYLRDRVKALGGTAYKWVSPGLAGVADRIVLLPGGVVWFVEVKAPSGRMSPLQKLFARRMAELQMNYVCVWSREDVDEWLGS